MKRTIHSFLLWIDYSLGTSYTSIAETFEPDEDHRNEVLPLATDLGHKWLETAAIRQPRNQTGLVAKRFTQLGRNEKNGWQKGRWIV